MNPHVFTTTTCVGRVGAHHVLGGDLAQQDLGVDQVLGAAERDHADLGRVGGWLGFGSGEGADHQALSQNELSRAL
jgi:hypothetical protein